ncbi:uncharacterized protein LOC115659439 [Gopherus evgoodei]|uniref:uncharacterized protein LOC115659439 n=1 Tax=Gopherus evgoodei TaxID=1825980 RepID=UPI0011CFAEB3|nr:uncharacterized protein LOC115659439 [Gopherus evgoodei]XP_030435430.1 uncharacterized protein LOC115659439 [Gopherus evgoodei]
MALKITEAGKELQWNLACSEIQDFLNDQLMAIRSDLEHEVWPTALTDTSGMPFDLWPWRHTQRFSGWSRIYSQCSSQAYGPVGGVWAPTYRILSGPWGGCMWDWIIHHDIWEIRSPGMPSQFVVSASGITLYIWIGIGNQWTLWPLEPPQLQCVRKLKQGEVATVFDKVCWEGMGRGTTLTGQLLFQANDSCVYVKATTLQDMHFNLTMAAGNHIIYWPADKALQLDLRYQISFNWTTLIPDQFQNVCSILPEIQKISDLQGQIHVLQNIYQIEKHAFYTAYRVSTLCTNYDVMCYVIKAMKQPQHIITMGTLMLVLLLFSPGVCYCCCKGCTNKNAFHVHTNHAFSLYPVKTIGLILILLS